MGTSDLTNRLGIFIYYDELPGIENYVIYILKEMSPFFLLPSSLESVHLTTLPPTYF